MEGGPKPALLPSGEAQAGDVSTALARLDFGDPALVDPMVSRDIVLVVTPADALPDSADGIVSQFGAPAPFLACHVIVPFDGHELRT